MSVLTPSQTIGPFFIEGLKWAIDGTDRPLAPGTVRVTGRVLDVDGKGAGDALLEVWQPAAPPAVNAGLPFAGFQRVAADDEGRFCFRVAAPVMTQVAADVTVFSRGLQRHLFTRVHLGPGGDAARAQVPPNVPPQRRATLIATRSASDPDTFEWDICLRGGAETVFFEL
jgi:protocatechuate 3,4-dioxygenase alpha subunit